MGRKSKRPTDIEKIPEYILDEYRFDIIGFFTGHQICQSKVHIKIGRWSPLLKYKLRRFFKPDKGIIKINHSFTKRTVLCCKGNWYLNISRKHILEFVQQPNKYQLSLESEEPLFQYISAKEYEDYGYSPVIENFSSLNIKERFIEIIKSKQLPVAEELERKWREAQKKGEVGWEFLRADYYDFMSKYYSRLAKLDRGKDTSGKRRPKDDNVIYWIRSLMNVICDENMSPNELDIGLVLVYFNILVYKRYLNPNSRDNLTEIVRGFIKRNIPNKNQMI